jgi:hypothetical protein
MKTKLLLLVGTLTLFCLIAGSGTALAGGKYRGDRYGYNRYPVVVYQVQPRVVYKHHTPAYGRMFPHYVYPHRSVYVYSRPVIVKQAPVYPPVHPGWGVSIHFGY